MLPAVGSCCARAPFELPNGTGGITASRLSLEKQLHRQLTSYAAVSLILVAEPIRLHGRTSGRQLRSLRNSISRMLLEKCPKARGNSYSS